MNALAALPWFVVRHAPAMVPVIWFEVLRRTDPRMLTVTVKDDIGKHATNNPVPIGAYWGTTMVVMIALYWLITIGSHFVTKPVGELEHDNHVAVERLAAWALRAACVGWLWWTLYRTLQRLP